MIEIFLTNTCPPDLAELTRRSEGFTAYAPNVQLDVCDARFAPTESWPYFPGQWDELAGTKLPFSDTLYYETHLMVEEPIELGEHLARAGVRRVIPHAEPFADDETVLDAFARFKAAGAEEVGVALLMQTPLSRLDGIIESCDVVQLMSINTLGAQGAPFEPAVISRVTELRAAYPGLMISIDGGVSEQNIQDLVRAGANRFGVGSAIMKKPDPAAAYRTLLSLAEEAV